MKTENIHFENSDGETLAAQLDLPLHSKPLAYAIFAHCFTCSKNLLAVKHISRALCSEGIAVFRFDFTGLGDSDGSFEETSFTTNIEDLVTAANYLKEHYQPATMLIGHSLGGAAVLFAAQQIEGIEAVATIGAPADPKHVKHLLKSDLQEIEQTGRALVNIGGRDFYVRRQFVEDINNTNVELLMSNFRIPLLLLHSPQDATVGIENAAEIYAAAWHPKSFVSLDQADHLLSNKDDSEYAGTVIGSWAKRYLKLPPKQTLQTKLAVAVRTSSDSYTSDIVADGHPLLADEPEDVGGNNLGPTPYGLLTAGLGACTAMTVQMYAKRKGWPLQHVVVHLNHSKDHATDCEACEQPSSKIDQFERIIEFHGELDSAQKQRLLEIADKCPVHKTLQSEVKITTKLQEVQNT